MMQLSICTNVSGSSGDPENILRLISESGFTHLLWSHHWNSDFAYGKYELTAIKEMLRKYRLQLQDVHGCANAEKSFFSPIEYQRKAGIELIENRIEMMKYLDASGVLVMHQPRIKTDSTPDEIAYKRRQFASLLRSMDELIPILEKSKIRIALENMPGDTWEFQRHLLDNYPEELFGFCFDSGHANINLRNQLDDCYEYSKRITALHLHDNNGITDQHTSPFTGNLDWQKTAEIVRNSGYTGVLNFELHIKDSKFAVPTCPAGSQPESALRSFLADAYTRCMKFAEMCGR
ncbi:MAG: sugar phosphate isomerase/epimerase [Lentisphaerae bacterium]|nr:sugar phosphate isomerase/epimerase [Lentisphaerota bacterium]